ncbi:hypothetical protein ABZV78_31130 [Micromonospora sp. NPDC004540]|uniref:hypothetical protein n=1 Tax=Micromonospora sp. NPDC004540 TaxID=3154457 RepID=UPI0033AFB536
MSADVSPSSPHRADARRVVLHRFRRPITRRALDNGNGVAQLPDARELAEVWAAPVLTADVELFRSGSAALLSRPRGSSAAPVALDWYAVADRLAAILRGPLPENTAGTLYADLNHYALYGDPAGVRSYLVDVIRAVRRASPLYVDPDPPTRRPRRTGRTPEQRREDERQRARANRAEGREGSRDDMMTAAGWVAVWRDQVGPGAHSATDVYRTYVDRVTDAHQIPVGRNTFYRLAEEVLGPRKRRASGPVFVVSQEVTPMDRTQRRELAALIVDRLTEEWRTAALDGLADLLAERQAVASAPESAVTSPAITGAGNVVSLAAHRARRVA